MKQNSTLAHEIRDMIVCATVIIISMMAIMLGLLAMSLDAPQEQPATQEETE